VVPNFVDPGELGPQPATPAAAADEPITILFPRRSEPRRGIDLMAAVAPRLAARFPATRFRFAVGSGHHTERLRGRLCVSSLPADRWSIESLPFESMPEAYASAAIAVVPTVCGEGTSLAALEAMWFGCALVATWVGGLPNLVCDDRDGLLIPPLEAALEQALARLCADRALRVRLGGEAQATARHFAVTRWRERVQSVLAVLGEVSRR
jgi:glycosyltransferase involved in cell wall biosynthesis